MESFGRSLNPPPGTVHANDARHERLAKKIDRSWHSLVQTFQRVGQIASTHVRPNYEKNLKPKLQVFSFSFGC